MEGALPLVKLVEQFAKLPGVGRKTAQRFAFHILDLPEEKAREFAQAILDARTKIKKCPVCGKPIVKTPKGIVRCSGKDCAHNKCE